MASSALNLLIQAVKERRAAVVRYDGQHHIRVVEPHALFVSGSGAVTLDCFQTRGFDRVEHPDPQWSRLDLARVDSVFLLASEFRPRMVEGYSPNRPEYMKQPIALVTDMPMARHLKPVIKVANSPDAVVRAKQWWSTIGSAIDRALANDDYRSRAKL